ncbi:MAG TPA: SPOR domain-containing protein [Pseudomonadales bacterium]|nr:SPOR domain-containing protein [Pseudomonadales bacterium]
MKQTLRQRLVGALVLLAIGVILWPVIFDEGPKRTVSKISVIPPAPSIEPVVIEPLINPVPSDQATFGPTDDQGLPLVEELDQEVIQQLAALPAATPAVVDEQGLPEAWSIQVGAFSNQTNALALVKKLQAAGFKAYLRERDGLARVLVGPKLTKQSAAEDLRAIEQAFELQGRLVRYAP